MPAPRPRSGDGLIDQLNASAPTRAANNALPISAYYRGCDLLLSQAKVYRSSRNEEQLYVMLMRFASLVIETIPKHAQFSKDAPQYLRFSQQVKAVMAELEQLKLSLQLRNVKPAARSSNRPADAALLVTSNLPGIDWASVGAGTGAAAATDSRFGAEAAEWLARYSSGSAAGPPAALRSPGSFGSSTGGSYSYGSGGGVAAAAPSAPSAPPPPPAYQAAYVPASQQALEKHSLFGPRAPPRGAAAAPQPPRPRYPDFDRSPAASIDLLWSPGGGATSSQDGGAPSAPPEEALAALELAERRASAAAAGSSGGGPMDGALPRPSAGPGLGPQELAVHSMDSAVGRPGGTCAHPAAAPGGGAVVSSGGVRPLEKRIELRDIHISVALMNDFLHYASTNTRRGIESCGILAGTLSAGDSIFCVTTLIIPKQEGTSDTVAALNEEEIYEAQASRELYPLGWIHTHPTQTCFLSSVDVHTQCGYQTMLDEAVAIVMAPTDSRNKCGIFRLTTPGGLSLIQKCALRGFHTHPPTSTGQEVYELCGHVYLNPRTRHEVLDLR